VSSPAATPSSDDVLDFLRATMQSEFGIEPSSIELSAHLIDDLDLDSIDLVDLAVSLEEKRGIKLDEEELKSVRTVERRGERDPGRARAGRRRRAMKLARGLSASPIRSRCSRFCAGSSRAGIRARCCSCRCS
jgi:acyl carrier protein